MSASIPTNNFRPLHAAVLLMGMLVFVLLFLADKTNLNDDAAEDLGGNEKVSGSAGATEGIQGGGEEGLEAMLAIIPPANPSEDLAARQTALKGSTQPEERKQLLRSLVGGFRDAGRLDVAAVYAGMLAREAPETKNLVVAGALFRNAAELPAMQPDTNVFRKFSNEAIRFLESALELEPDNEDAKIELGLAIAGSRRGAYSMQGILKLREVAEKNPENAEALFHLGKFAIDVGKFEKAEERFRQILEINPKAHTARYFLGIAVQKQNKTAEFKQLMTEVSQQQDDPALAAAAASALEQNN